jgi:hypothetical protein
MHETHKEDIIRKYIEAYNRFNIDEMLTLVHPDITFRNISHGETNVHTHGKPEFEALARKSAASFTVRSQSLRSLQIIDDKAIAEIDFLALLARDLPHGLKAGEKLELKGTSEFLFKDGLIWSVTDES